MDTEAPVALNESTKRDELAKQLEKAAVKLGGQRRDSFVDTKSLCVTCKWATLTRQHSKNNRRIDCSNGRGSNIPDDITECTGYSNITELSLSQMAEIAWLVDNQAERIRGYL